jgi:predicted nuclease of restriction endonuclease-like (RecB) superfamily
MNVQESPDESAIYKQVVDEIKQSILTHRYRAAKAVNRELLWLYWLVGRSLSKQIEVQGWGARVLQNLSDDLQREFTGLRGFSVRNLKNMRQFAEAYPELDKVVRESADSQPTDKQALKQDKSRFEQSSDTETYFYLALTKELFLNVGFTHHILLLSRCKDLTERRFYMEETVRNQWTVDTL